MRLSCCLEGFRVWLLRACDAEAASSGALPQVYAGPLVALACAPPREGMWKFESVDLAAARSGLLC